jgi:predicted dehydrogenase
MGVERFRVAIVGMGKMGILHSCILRVLPDVEIVAVCEKSYLVRRLLGRILGQTLVVSDISQLSDLDLDAVYVTTPIPTHFVLTKALLSNHVARNIFVEKTLASNSAQAKELCKLANGLQGTNMVGYLRRYYVTFGKAKDLLAQRAIGKVTSFKAYAYSSDFFGISQSNAPSSRGGVLRDLGCHAADLALWFFGEMEVYSSKVMSIVSVDSEDRVDYKVKSSQGVEGDFSVSWCMDDYRMPEVGFRIIGSEGVIEVSDDKVQLQTKSESAQWYRHNLADNVDFWLGLPEYYREDSFFFKAIRERRSGDPDFVDASKVDEVLEKVEEAADRN